MGIPHRPLRFFHFSLFFLVFIFVGNNGGGAFAPKTIMVIILPVLQQGHAIGLNPNDVSMATDFPFV